MPSANYYRAEAERCRELAARSIGGSIMSNQWLTIAAEYETLADALEGAPMWGPTQQQPMQQQQAKAEPEDEK